MSQSVLFYQSFIGVDLHKTTVTLVAVAPDGGPIARLTINTKCRQKIAAWLAALPRPSRLAVEAVGFVEWFIECFRPCVDRIDIADATELANRRGKRRKRAICKRESESESKAKTTGKRARRGARSKQGAGSVHGCYSMHKKQ